MGEGGGGGGGGLEAREGFTRGYHDQEVGKIASMTLSSKLALNFSVNEVAHRLLVYAFLLYIVAHMSRSYELDTCNVDFRPPSRRDELQRER